MSVYFSMVSALTEMSVKGIATIDDCILDDATSSIAQDVYQNLKNFTTGTGTWIVLAMLAFGVIASIFGNSKYIKRAGIGVVLLVLFGAIVTVVSSSIGSNSC